tara:strand:- start:197 stop:2602 length:2406 start_codon:yes stop_codon:yes gene_type:complete
MSSRSLNDNPVHALDHLRVLDLAGREGQYIGKLFADLGADVVKIEPPGGDPARRMAPFVGDVPDREASLVFLNYNSNKRSAVVDLAAESGRETLRRLASSADLLIETFKPGHLDELGLGYGDLSELNPSIVVASVTPFGQSGPYSGFAGSELVAQAMGGVMYIQGDDNKPPCMTPCDQASQLASLHAAYGALTALRERHATGLGQHVDVSMQDVVAHLLFPVPQYSMTREIIRRTGATSTLAPNNYYECLDGRASLSIFFPHHWQVMIDWMDIDALRDPMWQDYTFRRSNPDIIDQFVAEFVADFTVADFVREGQKRHLAVSPMSTIEGFANDPHIRARDFYVNANHPRIGKHAYPGAPYLFARTPWQNKHAAPLVGGHTERVLAEADDRETANRQTASSSRPNRDGAKPLKGVRILDFTRVWAGPYATRYLADLGAEVLKVETEEYLDGGRIAPGSSPMFPDINRSKLGITVNFRQPDGAKLVRELVAVSDVVIDNFAAGVLGRRGLGYDDLREIKPDIVQVSMPGYGATGPYSDFVAYGQSLMAYAGLSLLWGFPDSPLDTRPNVHYSDFVSAGTTAFAIMSALEHRAQSGQGQYIEVPQSETLAATMGVTQLDYLVNGRSAEATGNRSLNFAPHGCYPCRGDDQWCAITCLTEEHWLALCQTIEADELATDPRFATMEARLGHQDELDEIIGQWTAQITPYQVMWRLQDASVPAGVVQSGEQLFHDMHMRSRGFIAPVEHNGWDTIEHTGITVNLSRTPGSIESGIPGLGQHNSHVFSDLLGNTASEVDAMTAAGAIG